jgi:hypothetical protein
VSISVFDGLTAVEHAEAAAEAIRAINHLTINDTALGYPSDAWRLVGQLATLTARLPQAFEQITGQLNRWQQAGLIGIDPGTRYAGDPATAVATAGLVLTESATVAAAALHSALTIAGEALTYAHYTGPDIEHDDTERDEDQGEDECGQGSTALAGATS